MVLSKTEIKTRVFDRNHTLSFAKLIILKWSVRDTESFQFVKTFSSFKHFELPNSTAKWFWVKFFQITSFAEIVLFSSKSREFANEIFSDAVSSLFVITVKDRWKSHSKKLKFFCKRSEWLRRFRKIVLRLRKFDYLEINIARHRKFSVRFGSFFQFFFLLSNISNSRIRLQNGLSKIFIGKRVLKSSSTVNPVKEMTSDRI